jgi:hypothetical protein
LPVETVLKLTAIIVGMTGEFCTAVEGGIFKEIHNGQHMTMFGFFLFHCLFELLYFYRTPFLPPGLDYFFASLAFGVEALLFAWHLHGRSPIDVQVHTFLVYAVVSCAVATAVEMVRPCDVRATLLRCACVLLQAVWFWNIGFILYPPAGWQQWKIEDHNQAMIITMMFAWSVAAVFTFLLLAAVVVYRCEKRMAALGRLGHMAENTSKDDSMYTSLLECKTDDDVMLDIPAPH